MPIYEYSCQECGHVFEEIQSSSSRATPQCPRCGAKKTCKIMSAQAPHCGGAAGPGPQPAAPSGSGCGGAAGFR